MFLTSFIAALMRFASTRLITLAVVGGAVSVGLCIMWKAYKLFTDTGSLLDKPLSGVY